MLFRSSSPPSSSPPPITIITIITITITFIITTIITTTIPISNSVGLGWGTVAFFKASQMILMYSQGWGLLSQTKTPYWQNFILKFHTHKNSVRLISSPIPFYRWEDRLRESRALSKATSPSAVWCPRHPGTHPLSYRSTSH